MHPPDDPFPRVGVEPAGSPEQRGLVRRDRLLQRLAAASHAASLTVLVAPPGYGKTTLLRQWAAQDPRAFAWVTVEDADNDPVSLLRHIVRALRRIEPVEDGLLATLASPHASPRGVVLPRLLAWLAGHAGGGRVLVLDDLHRLHDPTGIAVIGALATRLPPAWHLGVASRTRPAEFGALRGQSRYLELGTEDLAFSAQEAGTALAEAGVTVPEEAVASLARRTEGWPAGIHLAALSLRAGPGKVAAAQISGDDATLAAYFRSEVLDRQPPGTVTFLLRTAVLERMSGPLCDAVLGATGSAARLTELESRNLFVVPQDRRGEWYRYHHLFAELLRSELRRREPGTAAELHRRAATWFEEHDLPEEAVSHALAGRDVATAARLTTRYGQFLASTGRIATVRGWIETMGDDGPAAYAPLSVTATWVWALEGDAEKARRSLATAESVAFEGRPADGSTSFESGVCIIRGLMAPLGFEEMLADGRRASELEPPGSPWHPIATWLLGSAELMRGDLEQAAKAFERAAYFGREQQKPAATVALAELSLLAADRNDWTAATAYAADARELVRAGGLQDNLAGMLGYVAGARVSAHEGDRESTQRNVGNALRLYSVRPTPLAFPWLAAQVAVVLGRILLELDDVAAARLKVVEARRHLAGQPTEGALHDQVRRLASDVTRRGRPVGADSVMTLTGAEFRVLHLLPTHLSLAEIAAELDVSRNTVKTQVAAVYRKLQATTRPDAVRRGRELGLLGS